MKFAPNEHQKPQQVTYSTVKYVILHYIQKYFSNRYDLYSFVEKMDLIDLLPENTHIILSTNSDETLSKI